MLPSTIIFGRRRCDLAFNSYEFSFNGESSLIDYADMATKTEVDAAIQAAVGTIETALSEV